MRRLSISIVIPVWNQWRFTKDCLESIGPTIKENDEVIVVNNGSTDETAMELAKFEWVQTITNDRNEGAVKAFNQGAHLAKNDIIIFLNNDTLTPLVWLDGLLRPFEDDNTVATGPTSNGATDTQLVADNNYDPNQMDSLNSFASQLLFEQRGLTTQTVRLSGFCLAVRRKAFWDIGGFDGIYDFGWAEDDDLCMRLAMDGGKLFICHDSYVHHFGHVTFDAHNLDWRAIAQQNQVTLANKFVVAFTSPETRSAQYFRPVSS